MNQKQFQMFMEATKSSQKQITNILELLFFNKATNRSWKNQDQFIQAEETILAC